MTRLGILASGRGSNLEALIRSCREGVLKGCAEVAVVVSDRPGSGALKKGRAAGVPTHCVDRRAFRKRRAHEEALASILDGHQANLILLAGYMRILTPRMVERFRGRLLNIHPAPTHLHRGVGGYSWAWENRSWLEQTYATVHHAVEELDAGDVILYGSPLRLADFDSEEALASAGLEEEHVLYPLAILEYLGGAPAEAVLGRDPRRAFTRAMRESLQSRRSGDALKW